MKRRLWVTGPLLVTGGLLGGCAETPAGPTPLERLPREITAAEQEVISASNSFAFGLLREVDRTDGAGNVFLSPLSATMALGMTMNGAEGETFSEMRSTLGFEGIELEAINESYRDLIQLLLGLDPRVDTRIANSIWYREDFPFEQSFFDVVNDYFSAEATGLRMVDSDRATINDWVDKATAGKIPEIVDEIRDDHVMFLINAIYFKGSWADRFDRSKTRDEPFHLSDGSTVPVKMMNRKGGFDLGSTTDLQIIEMPYGNGAFAMTVLLPSPTADIDEVVASLDAEKWDGLTAGLHPVDYDLAFPRFRIEYKQELNDVLKALGMKSAFVPGGADFTRMSATSGHDLFISRVVQKTFVDVNEEGTEAAAATSVEIGVVSLQPTIRVDRPFIVAIRERFSGTILFIGKVVDPS
jgi:serine protease inhibitor